MGNTKKILIAVNDMGFDDYAEFIKEALQKEGMACTAVINENDAVSLCQKEKFDLYILHGDIFHLSISTFTTTIPAENLLILTDGKRTEVLDQKNISHVNVGRALFTPAIKNKIVPKVMEMLGVPAQL